MENYNNEKYNRAKKRVDEMRAFYIHLGVYIVVNAFILVNIFIRSLNGEEEFWKLSTFFTAIFWGLGVLFHGVHTFNLNPFFGKKWEERQIQKYIENDKKEAKKYQ